MIDRAAPVRSALAFPNTYRVGMASLGFQLIYRLLNSLTESSCERVFLPDADDLQEHVRTGTELFTLETQSPLSEFDVVGFSISYEMDYLNALRMLQLANIPVLAADRDESHPLVIAGGPCPTFNPEPLAEFIDAFVIGDAEPVLGGLVGVLGAAETQPREEVLAALSQAAGTYVPRFYKPDYVPSGELRQTTAVGQAPTKVQRIIAGDLDCYPAAAPISTPEAEFGDVTLVEVARGCGRRCRFCAAGHITRPVRFRDLDGLPRDGRVGLVGAAVFDHTGAQEFCESVIASGNGFTVSSLRLETVTPDVARLMRAAGQRTLTIAPEAATERLRRVINKTSSDEELFAAARAAHDTGFRRLKLYFMIGLPTEIEADVEVIIDVVSRLAREFAGMHVQVSASCFVPKPWTAFQWHPMEREDTLRRRFSLLRKGVAAIPGASLSGESPRLAAVQGILARGDRRVSRFLLAALGNGGDYPAALRDSEIDADFYLCRQHCLDELFPWDHTDVGIRKDYLWREYEKALRGEITPACEPAVCTECGVCIG